MNIFGFQLGDKVNFPIISDSNINVGIKDRGPVIRPELKGFSIPEHKQPANILPVKPNVLSYNTDRGRRGDFIQSEYDLSQVGRVEDTDSYVHQAYLKKIGLLFKEGYEFVGPNPRTIQYIKSRLDQIARATSIPTDELVKAIGSGLIKKSNAFLVKVRKESASGGQPRQVPGKEKLLQPIAGYFIAPPETMLVDADKFGKVRRWKQRMHDGSFKIFAAEDVVHFYFNKKEGLMFGTPTLVPVIDDIRALRKIEENIELLIYQHLFPLFHYQIGSDAQPATITEQGETEIEIARREIQYMPSEGGIVTSHRHNIELIGTENRALRAESYLEHFKKRVFSGLGISAVDMGEGECYDSSTQTLTESGWKFHWAIDHTKEKIATYNPESKRIEFHIANYKYENPYVGKMIKFKNSRVDILVTPNHDMWVCTNDECMWTKMSAKDILAGKAGYKCHLLSTTSFADKANVKLPHKDEISLAAVAGYIAGNEPMWNEPGDFLFLKGRRGTGQEEDIIKVLSDLEIPWTAQKVGNKNCIRIDANTLGGFFKKFTTVEAFSWAENFTLAARKVFACNFTKVAFRKRDSRSGGLEYYMRVTEPLVVDLIQRLLISAGYNCNISEKHSPEIGHFFYLRANLRERKARNRFLNIKRDVSEVDYSGIIYCYNVPNHLFVTRRNKLITIQGNTANRATSDNMSQNLVDSVKDIQRTLECQVNDFLVSELLLESNFGSDVLNQEHKVFLKFKEIDLDHQIKKENHHADLFAKNAITIHEARIGMGRQPFDIPTSLEAQEIEDLAEQFPEWHSTFWKLIDEPKALIQAVDEPFTPAAKAAAASRSTSVTETQRVEAGEEQLQAEERRAKTAAANKPQAKTTDFLTPKYNDLESDLVEMVNKNGFDFFLFRQLAISTQDSMSKDLNSRASAAFMRGYKELNSDSNQQIDASIRSRSKIQQRIDFYIERLIRDTINAVDRQSIADLSKGDRIHRVKAVFDSFRFRNKFMEDVEIRKAHNLGFLEAARDLKFSEWRIAAPEDSCDKCKNASADSHSIQSSFDLEEIPPLHASARAEIEVFNKE